MGPPSKWSNFNISDTKWATTVSSPIKLYAIDENDNCKPLSDIARKIRKDGNNIKWVVNKNCVD